MADFKGIKAPEARFYDEFCIWKNVDNIILGVLSPEHREDAAMRVTPATARKIASELLRLADEIENGMAAA